jgi:hypothetical protein
MHASNIELFKYIEQLLTDLKSAVNSNTIIGRIYQYPTFNNG